MENRLPPLPPQRSLDDIIASVGSAPLEPPAGSIDISKIPVVPAITLGEQTTFTQQVTADEVDPIVLSMSKKYPETIEALLGIQENQLKTFCKKNNDYGLNNILLGGNINDADDRLMALRGIAIRMNDKMERIKNMILKGKEMQNESVEDSFLDISLYGIIALMVYKQQWGK